MHLEPNDNSLLRRVKKMNPYDPKTETLRMLGIGVQVPVNMVLWTEFLYCIAMWATCMSNPGRVAAMSMADRYKGTDAVEAIGALIAGPVSGAYAMMATGIGMTIATYLGRTAEERMLLSRDRSVMMGMLLGIIAVGCAHTTIMDLADAFGNAFAGWTVCRFVGATYGLWRLYMFLPYICVYVASVIVSTPSPKKRTRE